MGKPIWIALSVLVAATACDKPPTTAGPEPSASPGNELVPTRDELLLSRGDRESPVALTGTVTYWTYAREIRTILQSAPFAVPTPGTVTTLEYLEGDRVRLQLHEDHSASGEGDRWTTLEGTLRHNGKITLDYVGLAGGPMPEWAPGVPFLVGMVQWHSGCVITSGDFPTYHGRFEGGRLVAAAKFESVCPGPSGTPEAPLFPVPVYGRDGHTLTPVSWAWRLDLRVVRQHHDDHDGRGRRH